jgi:hypothetical protein
MTPLALGEACRWSHGLAAALQVCAGVQALPGKDALVTCPLPNVVIALCRWQCHLKL